MQRNLISLYIYLKAAGSVEDNLYRSVGVRSSTTAERYERNVSRDWRLPLSDVGYLFAL
jgi:hypothetical protein